MSEHSFHTGERLKSRKSIEQLFRTGRSYISPPLRVIFKPTEFFPAGARMTVAVPKKSIRRAVDRNLLKRRVREAYRLNKSGFINLLVASNSGMELIFVYPSTERMDYASIEKAVKLVLSRMERSIGQD